MGTAAPKHRHTGWVWLLILAGIGFAGWHYRPAPAASAQRGAAAGRGGSGGPNAAPVPVVVAKATNRSIPLYLRNIGTVVPANTVSLHSRVDGQIVQVHFQEGQMVHQGDLLVDIDPRPYQAALAQAQGQLAHDTALYNDDQIDYQRYLTLYQQNIVAKQQLDSQAALVDEYKGAMASDQASIQTATLNLSYSKITAPVTGRIGFRQVDPGNIVHSSDSQAMAVITQVQPIAVLFTLPQQDLPQVYGELSAGRHPDVAAFDSTNTKLLAHGHLLTIDNAIDPSTGTFKLKAMFDNNDNALFPNQMVNARMQVGTATGLTVVPVAAVQRGPQGTYVYVVSPQNKVSVHSVAVQVTEGNDVGLSTGVAPGDTVVVDGADKLEEGSRVEASMARPAGPTASHPAAATAAAAEAATRGGRHHGVKPAKSVATDH